MIIDMLIVFVVIIMIMLVLSVYSMEDEPWLSIVFITVGMVFSILSAYEFFNFEWFYVADDLPGIYSTYDYGSPYGYVFMLMFFIFAILFVKAGANAWKFALETEAEMNYNKRRR